MDGKQRLKEKQQRRRWDDEYNDVDAAADDDLEQSQKHQPPNISPMVPVQKEAYGGGLYGKDDDDQTNKQPTQKPKASETQSADGPPEAAVRPKHKPPPSTGDRDLDITGQSYIQ